MADKIATRAAYGEFLVEKGRERDDLIVMQTYPVRQRLKNLQRLILRDS